MSLNAKDVRVALAQILHAGTGLGAYTAPDVLNPPCFLVSFARVEDYQQVAGMGIDRVQFSVQAIAARSDDTTAVDLLDELLSSSGPRSVYRLLQEDQTVAGTASSCVVRSGIPGVVSTDGHEFPAIEFTVEVIG